MLARERDGWRERERARENNRSTLLVQLEARTIKEIPAHQSIARERERDARHTVSDVSVCECVGASTIAAAALNGKRERVEIPTGHHDLRPNPTDWHASLDGIQ